MSDRSDRVVVVDCSFAIPWVIQEEHSAAVSAKLEVWERDGVHLTAPALFAGEAASVLRKHARAGLLTDADAALALESLFIAVDIIPHDQDLAPRALEIAAELGAGRAYDSLYAALAEWQRCELWTGDERFYNAARARYPWVRWIGEETEQRAMR